LPTTHQPYNSAVLAAGTKSKLKPDKLKRPNVPKPNFTSEPGVMKLGSQKYDVKKAVEVLIKVFKMPRPKAEKMCLAKILCIAPGKLPQEACPFPDNAGHRNLNDEFHKVPRIDFCWEFQKA
jgi:hypothetical protein